MKLTHIFEAGTGFRVIDTTERSQTAVLTLEATSEKPSRHEESDQTLIVLEGGRPTPHSASTRSKRCDNIGRVT